MSEFLEEVVKTLDFSSPPRGTSTPNLQTAWRKNLRKALYKGVFTENYDVSVLLILELPKQGLPRNRLQGAL
jgi:hypothetical protein